MHELKLKNFQRVLNYERQQFDLMVAGIVKMNTDILKIDNQLEQLQEQALQVLTTDVEICKNELHTREIQTDYAFHLRIQVDEMRLERKRLQSELELAQNELLHQRARLRSIELLVARTQTEIAKNQEHRANIELSDFISSSFTDEIR